MELKDAMRLRHSHRAFSSDAVPPEVLKELIDAAALAPSAMNLQPWRFHVTSGETRRQLCEIMAQTTVHLEDYISVLGEDVYNHAVEFYADLGGAPVAIVVSVPEGETELDAINQTLSAGCAIQNLMLAATEAGLGTCNVTFSFWVRDQIAELLQMEEGRQVLAIVLVGWPAAAPHAPEHRTDIAYYQD